MFRNVLLAVVMGAFFVATAVGGIIYGQGSPLDVRQLPENKDYEVVWRSEGGVYVMLKTDGPTYVYSMSVEPLPRTITVLRGEIYAIDMKKGLRTLTQVSGLSTKEIESMR